MESLLDKIVRKYTQRKMKRDIEKVQSDIKKLYKTSLDKVSDDNAIVLKGANTQDDSYADELSKLEALLKQMNAPKEE